ncbi:hypothetical protein AB9P05_02210 [Roseivirga sp. BDSF3-8]|uniref:hypothetical protein n=1 Tax=Roseivirga sp. BDSF3-8 TaxID=3241598 RepID=UPI003532274D
MDRTHSKKPSATDIKPLYAREVDLGPKKHLEITKHNQYDYELALYFMEHNDVRVSLSIQNDWILIEDRVNMSGAVYPLKISLPIPKRKE